MHKLRELILDYWDTYWDEIGAFIIIPLGVLAVIFILGLFIRYCQWVFDFLGIN